MQHRYSLTGLDSQADRVRWLVTGDAPAAAVAAGTHWRGPEEPLKNHGNNHKCYSTFWHYSSDIKCNLLAVL